MGNFFLKVQFLKVLIPQKVCGLDCILVAVPTNCDPELSDILAELFNTCLKECFFPRMLEGLIFASFISKWWEEVYC